MQMWEKIRSFLQCPDDSSPLTLRDERLICTKCAREYPLFKREVAEILPSAIPAWDLEDKTSRKAEMLFDREFHSPFNWGRNTGGWGDLTSADAGNRAFYFAQGERIKELLRPAKDDFAVDVSGAVGNYSLMLADEVHVMVNCDLHVPSLLVANNRKKANMLCVRATYLNLPFVQDSFDHVLCTDTLIRGRNHEIKLLKEIKRILKPGGKAFVDFHNKKWYADNADICSYSSKEIRELFEICGIRHYSLYPFGYVPLRFVFREKAYPLMDLLCGPFLPCQRYIVVLGK